MVSSPEYQAIAHLRTEALERSELRAMDSVDPSGFTGSRDSVLQCGIRPFDSSRRKSFRSLEPAALTFFLTGEFHQQFAGLQHSRLTGQGFLRFHLHTAF